MLRTIGRHARQNLVAYLALFVALGGTSYAAIILPANSVGPAQIRNDAVRSAKVKNRSLLAVDFRIGQLPAGARGAQGAPGTGAKGDPGTAGAKGDPGTAGAKGDPGTAGAKGDACLATDPACRGPQGIPGTLAAVLGRSAVGGVCMANTAGTPEACVSVSLTLPQAGRVLLVSAGNWYTNGDLNGRGECVFTIDGTTLPGPIAHTGGASSAANTARQMALTAVTAALAGGSHTFTVSCRQYSSEFIDWSDVQLSAVLLGAA